MPREGRLAHARNIALAELKSMLPSDFVIMIDMDIVGWDVAGVLESFSTWSHLSTPRALLRSTNLTRNTSTGNVIVLFAYSAFLLLDRPELGLV